VNGKPQSNMTELVSSYLHDVYIDRNVKSNPIFGLCADFDSVMRNKGAGKITQKWNIIKLRV